jgi:uncharacterized membrane protein
LTDLAIYGHLPNIRFFRLSIAHNKSLPYDSTATAWRDGRAVEGAALEKRYTLTGIVGSNPTLSAKTIYYRHDPINNNKAMPQLPKNMKSKILHWSPRILAILFVAFLCLFSIDEFNVFKGWESVLAIVIHLAVPIVVLLATILAWKKDLVETAIFFLFAVYYVYMVGLNHHWSWYASISGPALLTAVLFFINWLYQKKTIKK